MSDLGYGEFADHRSAVNVVYRDVDGRGLDHVKVGIFHYLGRQGRILLRWIPSGSTWRAASFAIAS